MLLTRKLEMNGSVALNIYSSRQHKALLSESKDLDQLPLSTVAHLAGVFWLPALTCGARPPHTNTEGVRHEKKLYCFPASSETGKHCDKAAACHSILIISEGISVGLTPSDIYTKWEADRDEQEGGQRREGNSLYEVLSDVPVIRSVLEQTDSAVLHNNDLLMEQVQGCLCVCVYVCAYVGVCGSTQMHLSVWRYFSAGLTLFITVQHDQATLHTWWKKSFRFCRRPWKFKRV